MMRIEPFKAAHLVGMQLQPAQRLSLDEGMTAEYARALEIAGGGYTALVDERVIACAGIVEQWRGRGLAWALIAEDAGRHFVRVTRAVHRALEMAQFRRVECHVDCEFGAAIRWAEMLGFEVESKMRAFTPEGRDSFMFVRVR